MCLKNGRSNYVSFNCDCDECKKNVVSNIIKYQKNELSKGDSKILINNINNIIKYRSSNHINPIIPVLEENLELAKIFHYIPYNEWKKNKSLSNDIPISVTNPNNQAAASFDNNSIITNAANEEAKQQILSNDLSMIKFTVDSNSLRLNPDSKCEKATLINAANCILNKDEFKTIMKDYCKFNGIASFHYVKDENNFDLKIPLKEDTSRVIISVKDGVFTQKMQLANGVNEKGGIKWKTSTTEDSNKRMVEQLKNQIAMANNAPNNQPVYYQPQPVINNPQTFGNQQYPPNTQYIYSGFCDNYGNPIMYPILQPQQQQPQYQQRYDSDIVPFDGRLLNGLHNLNQ